MSSNLWCWQVVIQCEPWGSRYLLAATFSLVRACSPTLVEHLSGPEECGYTELTDDSGFSVVAARALSGRLSDVRIAVRRRPLRNPQITGET